MCTFIVLYHVNMYCFMKHPILMGLILRFFVNFIIHFESISITNSFHSDQSRLFSGAEMKINAKIETPSKEDPLLEKITNSLVIAFCAAAAIKLLYFLYQSYTTFSKDAGEL